MGDQMDSEEYKSYQAAFDAFDWGHSGKIKYSSLQVIILFKFTVNNFIYYFFNNNFTNYKTNIVHQNEEQIKIP